MKQISVVIPSYHRGKLLLETLDQLAAQQRAADEVIVVDQTDYESSNPHALRLQALHEAGKIRWLRLAQPSIPIAMNLGLKSAASQMVLFLDDDILISNTFIQDHLDALTQHDCPAQVGCVIQPHQNQVPRDTAYSSNDGLLTDLEFPFHSAEPAFIKNCMAGNLVVDRQLALDCGGFDENFKWSAYRFETEFCRRLCEHTGKPFYFAPKAIIDHLAAERGGTRQSSHFLTARGPDHSMGDYYFAMLRGRRWEAIGYIIKRICRSWIARFYLRKPWYIPIRLVSEVRGLVTAYSLARRGPRQIQP